MKLENILNKTIEYVFYAVFLVVPLSFTGDTSELFEFNKLWMTFALTTIIAVAWIIKMIVTKQFKIQKTPLDIPILLFLASMILSTLFSIDKHVSLWGYYSRFNGGLYSIIAYIFLYYAFVSNLASIKYVKKALKWSLVSGLIVALWGLPSHFGYDPTCLIFRGTFDVSCWTNDFQPKVRIFSSLGQPDWLAAYLTILIPVSIVMFFDSIKSKIEDKKISIKRKDVLNAVFYLFLTILFYADLMYTSSRSGAIAGWVTIITILGVYLYHNYHLKTIKNKFIKLIPVCLLILFIVLTFITTIPFAKFQKYTLPSLISSTNEKTTEKTESKTVEPTPAPFAGEMGGTDSSKIRFIVWEGALNIWKSNPIFGSGVETFAYSYYNHRPSAHNLTSEWNFLYNKAHNEFLNYLATTGIFGFGSYLYFIILFLLLYVKTIKKLHKENKNQEFLAMGLTLSFIAILITNFFGFSVVITNIYLFLIPCFVLILFNLIDKQKTISFPKARTEKNENLKLSMGQYIPIIITLILGLYLLLILIVFWNADRSYAMGMNLNRAREYQQARPFLISAIEQRPGEPTYKDEYAINTAVLATLFASQQESSESAQIAQDLSQEASLVTDELTKAYPKNVVFLKTKTRVYYTLSQLDPRYINMALEAIEKAAKLAPTDANIIYNYAVISGQIGDNKKAVELLEKTIELKPDYYDAYYALGIFYEQMASNESSQVVNRGYHQKAIDQMKLILNKISPNDEKAKEALSTWEKK